jgi:hypothetical protein
LEPPYALFRLHQQNKIDNFSVFVFVFATANSPRWPQASWHRNSSQSKPPLQPYRKQLGRAVGSADGLSQHEKAIWGEKDERGIQGGATQKIDIKNSRKSWRYSYVNRFFCEGFA